MVDSVPSKLTMRDEDVAREAGGALQHFVVVGIVVVIKIPGKTLILSVTLASKVSDPTVL